MHTRLEKPHYVSPSELDRWLERGWYRVGQVMMTCRFVLNETGLRSAVWTRVPLGDYAFKRSHRKLLSRLDRDFRLVHGAARVDDAHEKLYERYLTVARGDRPATLREFMLGAGDVDRFASRELALYDGDELVAFSWFDVGARSMQSLIGVYDPVERRRSLGFSSLLLEMRLGMELGLDWHYSGYVLPGDPSMDYKLRPGSIEFLDEHVDRWRPWAELADEHLPAERMTERLREAARALERAGIRTVLEEYEPYGLRSDRLPQLLGEPLILRVISPGADPRLGVLVVYDLANRIWRLLGCSRAWAQRVGADDQPLDPIEVWVVFDELAVSDDPAELVPRLAVARLPR